MDHELECLLVQVNLHLARVAAVFETLEEKGLSLFAERGVMGWGQGLRSGWSNRHKTSSKPSPCGMEDTMCMCQVVNTGNKDARLTRHDMPHEDVFTLTRVR